MRDFTENLLCVTEALNFMNDSMRGIKFRIEGEVSSVNASPKYKGVYFSIKDEKSVLSCIIWKDRYRACNVDLEVGQKVELTGEFSIYPARGTFSFNCENIELAGLGKIMAELEALKKKLYTEGLMDVSRKREIPRLPDRIGLVTSGAGAAVHDCIRTIKRRTSFATVVFAGVNVEGKGAVESVISGLDAIENANVDVVLLVRGGGSFEDLLTFSDERLARRVATSRVPVVTGIGHEPDISICDLVSDMSCSTPTAAAEIVTAGAYDLLSSFGSYKAYFNKFGRELIEDSNKLIDDYKLRLDILSPLSLLASASQKLEHAKSYLLLFGKGLEQKYFNMLSSRVSALNALSPTNVMQRGFSYVMDKDRNIVKSAHDVDVDDMLKIKFAIGSLNCEVKEILD